MISAIADYTLVGLISLGTAFVFLAGLGVLRMPDLYLRISVTTKAATLGIGLILFGAAIHFSETSVTTRILAIILFLLLTAPVSAHLIGKASYFVGTPLWHKTVIDELKDSKKTESLLGIRSDEADKEREALEGEAEEVIVDPSIGDGHDAREDGHGPEGPENGDKERGEKQ